jgi:hypothetical protein
VVIAAERFPTLLNTSAFILIIFYDALVICLAWTLNLCLQRKCGKSAIPSISFFFGRLQWMPTRSNGALGTGMIATIGGNFVLTVVAEDEYALVKQQTTFCIPYAGGSLARLRRHMDGSEIEPHVMLCTGMFLLTRYEHGWNVVLMCETSFRSSMHRRNSCYVKVHAWFGCRMALRHTTFIIQSLHVQLHCQRAELHAIMLAGVPGYVGHMHFTVLKH